MKINGKFLADELLTKLQTQVNKLKKSGIIPTLAVIQIGDNPSSSSYIKQKQKAAERVGIQLIIHNLHFTTEKNKFVKLIVKLNTDPKIHGIIIQRPVPEKFNQPEILNAVNAEKDVDGFVPGSRFEVPVAMAVEKILKSIYKLSLPRRQAGNNPIIQLSNKQEIFFHWLQEKKITIIGRGETAGKPIADFLKKLDCTTSIIHSKTTDPEKILRKSDIIISCVGKSRVIRKDTIKPGVILISVGLWRDNSGKLHGDYEENEIAPVTSYYTPTPGGVGPINLACLMTNLVSAASKLKS